METTNELSQELKEAMRLLGEALEEILETARKIWEEIKEAFREWLKTIHKVAVWIFRYILFVELWIYWKFPEWLAIAISRLCPERWLFSFSPL